MEMARNTIYRHYASVKDMLFLPVHIINHPALTFSDNYHTNLSIFSYCGNR